MSYRCDKKGRNMENIKYKVVYDLFDNIYSAFARKDARIKYEFNQYVRSSEYLFHRGYYLCVFNKLDQAVKMFKGSCADRSGFKIFTCKVKGRHKIKRIPCRISDDVFENKMSNCFDEKHNRIGDFPEGTEMWEYVKLLKRVK